MIDENKLKKYIMTKINPYGKPFDGTVYEFGNMIMDYIERMEKEPERKWIPVSERLPEKYGEYLCCDKYGEYIIGYPSRRLSDGSCYVETECEIMNECIAWLPLPEPYKGGEE